MGWEYNLKILMIPIDKDVLDYAYYILSFFNGAKICSSRIRQLQTKGMRRSNNLVAKTSMAKAEQLSFSREWLILFYFSSHSMPHLHRMNDAQTYYTLKYNFQAKISLISNRQ